MEKLKIGFIGLGRMGSNMVLKLLDHDYEVVVYNRTPEKMNEVVASGATPSSSVKELVSLLPERKVVWLMVTATALDQVIDEVTPFLKKGDILVDGGNCFYQDTRKRYEKLKKLGIHFVDAGTSGGISGARHGACIMIGGDKEAYNYIKGVFGDLALPNSFAYLGDSGAGHYVKMVHNGIEYGMMSALAEGFETIKDSGLNIDLNAVAKVYAHGSIIESKLMSWLEESFIEKGYLDTIAGEVPKGETEDEMKKLLTEANGKMPSLENAVRVREQTRTQPSFTGKLISAMRNRFGGHAVNKEK